MKQLIILYCSHVTVGPSLMDYNSLLQGVHYSTKQNGMELPSILATECVEAKVEPLPKQ